MFLMSQFRPPTLIMTWAGGRSGLGSITPVPFRPTTILDAPGYALKPWNGGPTTGYYFYTKLSTMARPGPSKTFVFIEESPYSIDDGFFAIDPRETDHWVNSPAVLHGNASEMSYGDGHADARQWTDSLMIHEKPATPSGNTDGQKADPNSGDLNWLNSVATAPSS
jgi:hypothetical protein